MNKFSFLFLVIVLGCSTFDKYTKFEWSKEGDSKYRVLLLGNSYSSFSMEKNGELLVLNNTPEILEMILGRRFIIESCVRGGFSLRSHFETEACKEKIQSVNWDFIILQEDSQQLLSDYRTSQKFMEAVVGWNPGTKYLIFQNWADANRPLDYKKLAVRTLVMSEDVDGKLIEIGKNFRNVQEKEQFGLLTDDGRHPSVYGIYVSAYTIAKHFVNDIDRTITFEKDVEIVDALLKVENAQETLGDKLNYVLTPEALKLLRAEINRPRKEYLKTLY